MNRDIVITSSALGNYVIPASDVDGNTGYVKNMDTIATHGGYITKGDNNPTSDQGSLYYCEYRENRARAEGLGGG